jgi:hypothetical protein
VFETANGREDWALTSFVNSKYKNNLSETHFGAAELITSNTRSNLSAQFSELSSGIKNMFSSNFAGVSAAVGAVANDISKTLLPNISFSNSNSPNNYHYEFSYEQNNSANKVEVANELLSYNSLRAGWDGPDSSSPSRSAIADAYAFIWRLPIDVNLPEPTVYADGQVGLYWQKNEDVLSIVFMGHGKYAYYGKVNGVVARSPSKEYSNSLPNELYKAISNI